MKGKKPSRTERLSKDVAELRRHTSAPGSATRIHTTGADLPAGLPQVEGDSLQVGLASQGTIGEGSSSLDLRFQVVEERSKATLAGFKGDYQERLSKCRDEMRTRFDKSVGSIRLWAIGLVIGSVLAALGTFAILYVTVTSGQIEDVQDDVEVLQVSSDSVERKIDGISRRLESLEPGAQPSTDATEETSTGDADGH